MPGFSCCTNYTCILPWGHWLHQLLWGECKLLSSAPVWKGASGISFSSTQSVYPHDFSYISLLTSWPFIYLKLPSDSRESAADPLWGSAAAEQLGRQQGVSVPLAQTMCGSSKALKNSLLGSVTVLHSPLLSTEWKGCCNHQLVFIGGLFVGCADLASAPSGGAGINPLQGEMHWSCPLRIFTWPFRGATIVSEGTALDAGDQGYCL